MLLLPSLLWGAFFVPKKDGRQRLILDTRIANTKFKGPWHVSLPTAAAWRNLELEAQQPLHLAQMDVNNAFYRIAMPPGLSKYFCLPQASVRALRACGADIPPGLSEASFVTPEFSVLVMGFSWSLYFCQKMMEGAASIAGYDLGTLAHGR